MSTKTLDPTSDASAAADFFGRCMMHYHRGAYDCGDKVVIFGNDGYKNDHRSQREVELLIQRLKHLEIFDPEFGVGTEGVTWALLIRNYRRDDIPVDDLTAMVWESWCTACEEQQRQRESK